MTSASPSNPSARDAARPAERVDFPAALAARQRPIPSRARQGYTAGMLRRRRWTVRLLKLAMPAAALVLLAAIVLWPEFQGAEERARLSFRRVMQVSPEAVRIVSPRYQGVDEQGRAYNVTARIASSADAGQTVVDLEAPRGDLFLAGGAWVLAEGNVGRYDRPADRLDLNGDVKLWHDNGTLVRTEEARVDVKGGSAEGNRPVQAQGSFGTVAGDGFRLRDRGAVIIFTGNARAVLEGGR
ncbi:LPS export ABC transporter periplasmic protein LptC [Roseomonas sp. CCTCC AB2023176]|uniref:LPS export ABC transporter periplasmic protein LptC n=1 Tax=Roseomonas sp. CCTCC AB2023176 TaxID=3342640 RepID=UPI0035DFE8B4